MSAVATYNPATNVEFPEKLDVLWNRALRWIVLKGGRGGAKSWGIARFLILECVDHFERVLCCREFQNSLAESVHQLLDDQIHAMALEAFFKITDKTIDCLVHGSGFIFAGLHNNLSKIKSMEGITTAWIEEAHSVSKKSLDTLEPTIRAEGSRLIVSYNPDEESDPVHKMFGGARETWPPDTEVVEIGWPDNPWFPEVLRKSKDHAYATDPESAEHIWGGKLNVRSDAQIFGGKYVVRAFEPQAHWSGPDFGQDFGFGTDPAVTTKSWYDPLTNEYLIEYAVFGYGVKNDNLAGLVGSVPGALLLHDCSQHRGAECELKDKPRDQQPVMFADCSRPETIVHLQDRGFFGMVGCQKWTGCVEDGIAWLRSRAKIVIHPRNKEMIDEAKLYRYKVDKLTGLVLPEIVDKFNHGWDAVRYGAEQRIVMRQEEDYVNEEHVTISSELDDFDMRERLSNAY
jgi:phage terminase large subunit